MENYSFDINMKLKRVNRLHKIKGDKELNELGIHVGQSFILEVIYMKKSCTQKEIADYLKISTSSITNPIKRLEEKKLIKKQQSKTDLRYNVITLTKEGTLTIKQMLSTINEIEQTMIKGFSTDEVNQLNDFFNRMIYNLQPEGSLEELQKEEYGNMYAESIEVDHDNYNR